MTRAEALRMDALLHCADDPDKALSYSCEERADLERHYLDLERRYLAERAFGFSRLNGNAYADRDVQVERKAPVEALDVAREASPHG